MRGLSKYRVSAAALIAANSVPLFGVIFFDWDTFSIVALYWLENVIIGAINVLKMIACSPDPAAIAPSKLIAAEQMAELEKTWGKIADKALFAHHASKFFFIPFFMFHYGMFCMGHGFFVFSMFDHNMMPGSISNGLSRMTRVVLESRLGWAAAALAASHLWSFFINYLGRGEFRRTFVPILMFQPYGRIVVLHIAILLGAFVAMALGSNAGVLVILVVGKTVLDLGLHIWEREFNARTKPAAATA